jgi:L-threonylcarbamoyladenylate synthase
LPRSKPAPSSPAEAAQILRRGGVVAFPTETVYGLAADAENEGAVRRVFELKGRPLGHPVIVHLADASQIDDWAREVSREARTLAERFMPGALTLVLRRTPRASDLVTGGQDTVALRVPSHPIANEILRAFGGSVIAPSANRFGHVSATSAEHVVADLGEAVDAIVDGGPTRIGIESTIVDCTQREPVILRPGGVTREQLEDALGRAVGFATNSAVRAPGTLPSHYAPRARVELADDAASAQRLVHELEGRGERVALIDVAVSEELARELYARLRRADDEGANAIVVVLPNEGGIGTAIRDRLKRAASLSSRAERPKGA